MMSSISFLVMLLIMITIPTILYSFYFLISCPANPFAFLRRNRSTNVETTNPRTSKVADDEDDEDGDNDDKNNMELIIASSSSLGKDDSECPICLSVFVEGQELRQLSICKHLFHRSCIDQWISTHCNCPVCRAYIRNHCKPNKERETRSIILASRDDRHDLWQGLPDSAGLV